MSAITGQTAGPNGLTFFSKNLIFISSAFKILRAKKLYFTCVTACLVCIMMQIEILEHYKYIFIFSQSVSHKVLESPSNTEHKEYKGSICRTFCFDASI